VVIKFDGDQIEIKGYRNLVNCTCGTTVLITDENNVDNIEFDYTCKGCGRLNSFKYSISDYTLSTITNRLDVKIQSKQVLSPEQ
jgi:hypothetical protein